MSRLSKILKQPEGRRLEFKGQLPTNVEFVKSIIAFANDAGGEMYIGVKENPREIVGLDQNSLMATEEKICNIIHDQCRPLILPEIQFLNHDKKHILVIKIHKGGAPPYHLKRKGAKEGTYIRVGSTNRLASVDIINEFERQKLDISFDSELKFNKEAGGIDLNQFKELFFEKTGEKLTRQVLLKLGLIKKEQGRELPTNALLLLSDDELRKKTFPIFEN